MKKLLTPQEMADLLSVKKSTIYMWSSQGYIPTVKLGGLLRFNPDEIEVWLKKKAVRGRLTRTINISIDNF